MSRELAEGGATLRLNGYDAALARAESNVERARERVAVVDARPSRRDGS